METDEKVKLANEYRARSNWFSFHGELYLFGVKVWEFNIPPKK